MLEVSSISEEKNQLLEKSLKKVKLNCGEEIFFILFYLINHLVTL